MVSFVQDTTAQVPTRQELEEMNLFSRRVINSLPQLRQMDGEEIEALVHPADRKPLLDYPGEIRQSRAPQVFTTTCRVKNGQGRAAHGRHCPRNQQPVQLRVCRRGQPESIVHEGLNNALILLNHPLHCRRRFGNGHPPGGAGSHLRAVLHHQRGRQGHRARFVDQLRHHRQAPG